VRLERESQRERSPPATGQPQRPDLTRRVGGKLPHPTETAFQSNPCVKAMSFPSGDHTMPPPKPKNQLARPCIHRSDTSRSMSWTVLLPYRMGVPPLAGTTTMPCPSSKAI